MISVEATGIVISFPDIINEKHIQIVPSFFVFTPE